MAKQIKLKSKIAYKQGTIVQDELNDNILEVVNCVRIGITDNCNYGLTLKKLTKKQVKEFLK